MASPYVDLQVGERVVRITNPDRVYFSALGIPAIALFPRIDPAKKTECLAALVALPELLRSARVAQEQTYNPTPLMAAAVIFFVMLYPCARWVARLERQSLKVR